MEVLAFFIHIWKYLAYFYQKQKNQSVKENIIECLKCEKGWGNALAM